MTQRMDMTAREGSLVGRAAYEEDVRRNPLYPNGSPRVNWDDLDEIAQWSWTRPGTPVREDSA